MPDPHPILPDTLVLPEKTVLGPGKILSLLPECARFGDRGILLHGASLESADALGAVLGRAPEGMIVLPFRHRGEEPTLAEVTTLIEVARLHDAGWIASVGGGSVLDLGKAAAALFRTAHPVVDYHNGRAIEKPGITFLAVPTTAGTGSEATINSVLTNPLTGAKKSIRDMGMMARVVVLDPNLLASCPPGVIAASGMDALTQAIEAFTSRHATWLSDQLARQGLALINAHLETVYHNPRAPQAEALLTGSYLAGVALSFARLGVVHGLAHPLGSLYHVPHGLVCAACLPHALELNRNAFAEKYRVMSDAVGSDLIARIGDLTRNLGIVSPFANQKILESEKIISETLSSGSTKANPKSITRTDVEWLLKRLFCPG
jgi:alcohol dehydrogenase class IV